MREISYPIYLEPKRYENPTNNWVTDEDKQIKEVTNRQNPPNIGKSVTISEKKNTLEPEPEKPKRMVEETKKREHCKKTIKKSTEIASQSTQSKTTEQTTERA